MPKRKKSTTKIPAPYFRSEKPSHALLKDAVESSANSYDLLQGLVQLIIEKEKEIWSALDDSFDSHDRAMASYQEPVVKVFENIKTELIQRRFGYNKAQNQMAEAEEDNEKDYGPDLDW